ncbi:MULTISPECIES: TetR/AcrR family transcriptional regulator [unclassified Streptomyces]|uniref:TetR/AcrR family transcriptional regulator n=1 Tax=unclassified Streptomyces TaxID=2593676 RepID=UPI001660B3D2|nr:MULTISPECIES: TetR/AcrR family transcriptional regulator [unclassified Streptomyces]MBD0710783.1 TetR family transcriptional regulator [Streptomyces sp. CBMA291]MBD0718136.1 TetR family transcriptional regulator [Streptomyces sp. CBMA370]
MARSRLTPERENELYGAVIDLLCEVGYDALTMDAVAARTHASKATLYRQWGSKPQLVAGALRQDKPVSIDEIDTGSLRGDFAAMLDRMDDCEMERDTALMRGLAHAVHTHPDLLEALRDVLVEPELTKLRVVLDRAVRRGEIDADNPALDFFPHLLIGAFVARPLIDGKSLDVAFLRAYVDAVVLPSLGV